MSIPSNCVFCGKPREIDLVVDAKKLANGKKLDKKISYKIDVPYCKQHEKESKKYKNILYGSFYAGFLLVLLIGGLLISRSFGVPSILLGIPLTLILAWIAGIIVELAIQGFLAKKYPTINSFSLVIPIPISSEDVLGLDLRIDGNPGNLSLLLFFDNETMAHEWAEINHTQVYVPSSVRV